MNKPAAISASLVDVRNVAAHKCVKLEIHVPAEQAPLVMEAFGWPTMVDPVPVAIARLAGNVTSIERAKDSQRDKLTMIASIKCGEPVFRVFLHEKYGYNPQTSDEAAEAVREICKVDSRRQFSQNEEAAQRWRDLEAEFNAWRRVPA